MFAYAYNPKATLKMRGFHKGEYIILPEEMSSITGAEYAFIGLSDNSERKRAGDMIKMLGYSPVTSEGTDACSVCRPAGVILIEQGCQGK